MFKRNGFLLVGLVTLGLVAGCAAQQASFRPAETTGYEMGYPATLYDITVDTQRLGIVRVYSQGAYATSTNGQSVVDVEMRIRNLSDAPMTVDLSKCDVDVNTDRGEQVLTEALQTKPLEPIPAGGFGRIALSYPLEGNIQPDDVSSFDFDWTLMTDKGVYGNTTPFIRRMVNNTYVYYPMYSGWWGYPWGWGWGGYWGPYYGGGYAVGGFGHGERGEEEHGGFGHGRGDYGHEGGGGGHEGGRR